MFSTHLFFCGKGIYRITLPNIYRGERIAKDNKCRNCMKRCSVDATGDTRSETLKYGVTPSSCHSMIVKESFFGEDGGYFQRMCISSCVELEGISTDCLVLLLLLYFRLTSFHLESVSVALLFS